ncbi:MAG TPA: MASE3 domain-containing protein [Clostridiales bacterium]|nr:MASE3 domain-containing protein [Clostridiales bacterium]
MGMYIYQSKNNTMKNILLQSILVITITVVFALFLYNSFIKYLNIYHTILELARVFIALSSFFSLWFTCSNTAFYNRILGFGYLRVAIFDIFHVFYFLKLNLCSSTYFDLSTKYWLLGRITEAIVLLLYVKLYTSEFKKTSNHLKYINILTFFLNLNKWIILFVDLFFTLCILYFTNSYTDKSIILLTERGVTPTKTIFECIIVAIYLLALYNSKHLVGNHVSDEDHNQQHTLSNKYILISLILSISAELFFIFYISITSVTCTIGHILKIVSCFYLFKSIFASTVFYPYTKLENAHKKLEETLRKSTSLTESLNDILDALPEAIIRYDQNGILKHANRKFEELLGYNRNDLNGHTEKQLLEKFAVSSAYENSPGVIILQNEDSNGNTISNVIRAYRTSAGDNIKLNVSLHKITDGFLKIFHDAKKEQELKNIHLQTQTILDAVTNCILMVDKNKKFVLCNKALEELYGLDSKNIIGMDIDNFDKLMTSDSKELLNLVLQGHTTNQYHETSFTSSNGSIRNFLLYLAPIFNIDEEIIGGISVGTDITAMKEQQQILLQQEKLALLGQMGASIVHESRNFLSTIKGRCQIIENLVENEYIKNHISKISSNVDELNYIMSEFLYLSKPREPEFAEVSMYDIIHSLKSMIETSSLIKGVNIEFDLSDEERYLMCDEAQIKQVILNICKNAVDAMDSNSNNLAILKVGTGYDKQANKMYIKISDNGKGISEEELQKIGTPFFTTKRNGTGLGLSTCYNIIKDHNGRIQVESTLGKGTTFTIILPCIPDEYYEDRM